MENFTFYNPTKIIFGKDSCERLKDELINYEVSKVLVLYSGDYLRKNGVLKGIEKNLDLMLIKHVSFGAIQPNPTVSSLREIMNLAKENNVDFILAVGGGSVIDTAKAIAVQLADEEINITQLLLGEMKIKSILPLGVILTIAGSGSESSCSLVLTIDEGQLKRSYDHELLRPKFAILDPTLTYTLPEYQMVSGGCDILMHTLERYFTLSQNTELIDRMSEGLLITIQESIIKSINNPFDYEARANLMWGGSLSHNGLLETGRCSDWATHRLEHELSGLYEVAHGAGLCALWGSWAKSVFRNNIPRFAQFAVNVMKVNNDFSNQEAVVLEGINQMIQFFKRVKMPTNFEELGLSEITDEVIQQMADNCLLGNTKSIGHLKELNRDEIIKIYKMARKKE